MKAHAGYSNLGFARVDIDRLNRRGFQEVIYSPGKSTPQLKKIIREFIRNKQDILLTKLSPDVFQSLKRQFPLLRYNALAKLGFTAARKNSKSRGMLLVISAGTADLPIAEEAAATAEFMGNQVVRLFDVGVAGVHRLLQNSALLRSAKVIIVVAGMEGALASLVSGLVSVPVVAVPTSCGYGASFSGLSALLTMLNGCSPGVTVVNIDNGFGAGYFASMINS